MKIRRISRPRSRQSNWLAAATRPRSEIVRTVVAVTLALALIGTGAVALPSFAPLEAPTTTFHRQGSA